MTPLADDALKWGLLLEYGVPVERDVIAWADARIEETEAPPATLIDLATTPPERTAAILSHLHAIGSGGDLWIALRAAMARLHAHLLAEPAAAERVAAGLYRTAVTARHVPDDFKFAYHFDDAFSLAATGTYGKTGDVRKEFLNALTHVTPKA
jgi:hypothetical protein